MPVGFWSRDVTDGKWVEVQATIRLVDRVHLRSVLAGVIKPWLVVSCEEYGKHYIFGRHLRIYCRNLLLLTNQLVCIHSRDPCAASRISLGVFVREGRLSRTD